MKITNFFKPTPRKIIVSVVIILLIEYWLYLIGLNAHVCSSCPPGVECPPCPKFHGYAIKFALSKLVYAIIAVYSLICIFANLLSSIIKKTKKF